MSSLRSRVIRLAHDNPPLRPHLLPLLAKPAAKGFNPAHYGLEGLLNGEPTTLFHGTTASFKAFDLSHSRDELVDQYYGRGIFLTPSKNVAERYANANRNMGLPQSVIGDLKRANPNAGEFLQALFDHGRDAWEMFSSKHNLEIGDLGEHLGVDGNTLMDLSQHIIGTKYNNSRGPDQLEELMGVFQPSATGSPDWVYDNLDEIGLDSNVYRPKVYTVVVKVENPLVTASRSEARRARQKKYDSVVYHGADLVGGVPEVAVYDPRKVRIIHVEAV